MQKYWMKLERCLNCLMEFSTFLLLYSPSFFNPIEYSFNTSFWSHQKSKFQNAILLLKKVSKVVHNKTIQYYQQCAIGISFTGKILKSNLASTDSTTFSFNSNTSVFFFSNNWRSLMWDFFLKNKLTYCWVSIIVTLCVRFIVNFSWDWNTIYLMNFCVFWNK